MKSLKRTPRTHRIHTHQLIDSALKIPVYLLKTTILLFLIAPKFLVENAVSIGIVTSSLKLYASLVLKHSDCDEVLRGSVLHYLAHIVLTLYMIPDDSIVLLRRYYPAYQTTNQITDWLVDVVCCRSRQMSWLNNTMLTGKIQRRMTAKEKMVFLLVLAGYYSSIYFYSIQSLHELVEVHPNFLWVSKWANNPVTQNILAIGMITSSFVANSADAIQHVKLISDHPRQFFNRRIWKPLLNAGVLAFTIRLFVVHYGKKNHWPTPAIFFMEVVTILSNVSYSLMTAGVRHTMDQQHGLNCNINTFKSDKVLKVAFIVYTVLGSLFYSNLGVFAMIADRLHNTADLALGENEYCHFAAPVWGIAMMSLFGVVFGSLGFYLYVNFVREGARAGLARIERFFIGTRESEDKRTFLTPPISNVYPTQLNYNVCRG